MLNHTGTLWQYLGSFVGYTLLTVGLIYGIYWYTRNKTSASAAVPEASTEEAPASLALEAALPLEPSKTLYVVRSGSERFLISTAGDGTQLLSRLEDVPPPALAIPDESDIDVTPKVDLPWYATRPASAVAEAPRLAVRRQQTFGQRFVQSVQWLVSSRMRK